MTVGTAGRILAAILALLVVLALMLVAVAPIRMWLGYISLPQGVAISRANGSLRKGDLVLTAAQLGGERPLFIEWQGCPGIGLERCWQLNGRDVAGRGRLAVSLQGDIDISSANLSGYMTLDRLFLLPISGAWEAEVRRLQFNGAACLPAEIDVLDASVTMRQGQVMGYGFDTHDALIKRAKGEDLQVEIYGPNISGEVSMDRGGAYLAQLSLDLPRELAANPLLRTAPGVYDMRQDGVMPCL